ncbi:hypothetical protein Tco_0768267 [Tanacetum coccineum]
MFTRISVYPNCDMTKEVRGRGKNKVYWEETEIHLLIEVLQDMACEPSWKTDGGFRSNYLCEVHKRILIKMPTFSSQVSPHIESKVKWLKAKYHVINDICIKRRKECGISNSLSLTNLSWYMERDRAMGGVVEGFGDAIRNMENGKNVESGGENIGEYFVSLSDDESDDVQTTQIASDIFNARNMAGKQKNTCNGDKVGKKKKASSSQDARARLKGIDQSFQMFVKGFNANFANIANAMTDDNQRQKVASEKLKDVLAKLVKLNIPTVDVLDAADIFSTNKEKMDVFLNLPHELRTTYIMKLNRFGLILI